MHKIAHTMYAAIISSLLFYIVTADQSVPELSRVESIFDRTGDGSLQNVTNRSEVNLSKQQELTERRVDIDHIRSMQTDLSTAANFRKKRLVDIDIQKYIQFINNLPEDIDRLGFIQDALQISFELIGVDKSQLITLIERELFFYPNDPSLLAPLASIYFDNGDYVKSIEVMKKIIDFQPENSDIFYQMGLAYHNMGDEVNSKLLFYKAAQKSPNYGWLVEMDFVVQASPRS